MDEPPPTESPKSRLVALILCMTFGFLGVHRFYVGKVGTGILMILTLGGVGIWTLIDFVMILAGYFRDKESRPLVVWMDLGAVKGIEYRDRTPS